MRHIILFPMLLPYCMTSVSALFLPDSRQAICTKDHSNTLLPTSLHSPSNISAPTPPPGFSTRLNVNSSVHLKPIEVYVSAIELMCLLATLSWDFILPGAITLAGPDNCLEIIPSDCTPSSDIRLLVQHAVLGLYEVGLDIAQDNQFYQLDAGIYVGDVKIGSLELQALSKTLHRTSNVHLSPLSSGYGENTTLRANPGRVIDPDDKKFVITYEWDGMRIRSQDIFTVILDALTIAAQHNNAHLDAYIPAARSASGDTVLSTWTIGGQGSQFMSWGRIKKALFIIWDMVVIGRKGEKAKFGGFVFGLKYDGEDIGAGRILKFSTQGEAIGGSAIAK